MLYLLKILSCFLLLATFIRAFERCKFIRNHLTVSVQLYILFVY